MRTKTQSLTIKKRNHIIERIDGFLEEKNPKRKVALAQSLSFDHQTELEEIFLEEKSQKEFMIFLACVGMYRAVRRVDAYLRSVRKARSFLKKWIKQGIGAKQELMAEILARNEIPAKLILE